MNKPVKFELAKLLKEKGFDKHCDFLYNEKGILEELGNYNAVDDDKYISYSALTIAEVIMWLDEIHGIWIGVGLTDNTREFYFQPTIWTSKDREYHDEDMIDQAKSICNWKDWKFDTPIEAYENAIEYTLNNLIK